MQRPLVVQRGSAGAGRSADRGHTEFRETELLDFARHDALSSSDAEVKAFCGEVNSLQAHWK